MFRPSKRFENYKLEFQCLGDRIAPELTGQGHLEAIRAAYAGKGICFPEYLVSAYKGLNPFGIGGTRWIICNCAKLLLEGNCSVLPTSLLTKEECLTGGNIF